MRTANHVVSEALTAIVVLDRADGLMPSLPNLEVQNQAKLLCSTFLLSLPNLVDSLRNAGEHS